LKIFNEISTVISNERIADNIYETYLLSPKISENSIPGQFINILPVFNWDKMMRRPMSIASQKDGMISIIYKIFGEGTLLMSKWKKNHKVDIIGPLGNSWTDYKSKFPILIGGGVGIAPILNLHLHLKGKKIKHGLICGARTRKEHFLKHEPEKKIYITTEDEQFGIKGNVITALELLLQTINKPVKLFSCGPHAMMHAIYNYSSQFNYDCDLALETIMACGIGICQGCTIEKKSLSNKNSYRNKFALACIDGPIFNVKELADAF